MIHLVPYKAGSSGIKHIRDYYNEQLGIPFNFIKPSSFSYTHYLAAYGGQFKKNLVVCWGNLIHVSQGWADAFRTDIVNKNKLLNAGAGVATNKRVFFKELDSDPGLQQYLPEFTESRVTAKVWTEQGHKVLCRTKLSGHSGDGIIMAETMDDVVNCQLYVKYVKKKDEYRVHINKFNNNFSWQQKRLRNGHDPAHPLTHQIRNHHNGWVYCRSNVNPPAVVEAAAHALRNSPKFTLDFAAVDIIYNQAQNKAYILEANTAPGLCGETVAEYAHLFKDWAEVVAIQ